MTRALPLILAAAVAASTGCTTKHNFVMSDTAVLQSENHQMWTRPVEVGYEIVGDVQGEAESETILGFKVGSHGGSSTTMFGLIGGGGPRINAVVGNASYEAVVGAGADAIYITRYTQTKTGFLMFYTHRHATVYGKALRLIDYGVVDKARADQQRFPEHNAKITIEGN